MDGGYGIGLAKSQKICHASGYRVPPYRRLRRFRNGGVGRKMGWVYNHSAYLNQMFTFVKNQLVMKKISISNGLEVQRGRLINNRPDGMTGIQQMCELKKMQKREQKIEMMVEADVRASMRERMMGYE